MLLEEVTSEPLTHSAYYVNQNLPTIQGLDNIMQQLCIYIMVYTVGFYYLKSIRCHWRLVPCYAGGGRI